jgi:hypothetical protein
MAPSGPTLAPRDLAEGTPWVKQGIPPTTRRLCSLFDLHRQGHSARPATAGRAGHGGRGRCLLRPALPVLPTYYDRRRAIARLRSGLCRRLSTNRFVQPPDLPEGIRLILASHPSAKRPSATQKTPGEMEHGTLD